MEQAMAATFAANHSMSPADLLKALIEEQQKTSDLQTEVEKFQKEIVNLQLCLKTQKSSGRELTSNEEVVKNAITHWAKFFGIFYFLGVTIDDFATKKSDFKHNNPSCYEEDNAHLGTVAVLYAVIPVKFMDYLFKFELLAVQKSTKRSQDPQIPKLLGLSGDHQKDKTPPMLAPVFFKDEDTQSISKLLQNSALFQIEHLIIYGPAALNSAKVTHHSDSPYVQDGHFPKATFGFIAWIATMTHFILSDDTEFSPS